MIEQSTRPPAGPPWRVESERIRFARAARLAVLSVRGVHGLDAGPTGTFSTAAGGGERLYGITCIAASGGGYDVSLRLVVGLVALAPLAQRVRAAVVRVATFAGVELTSVSVHFADLAAGEPA